MKTTKWMMGLFVYCVFTLVFTVASSLALESQDIQVGRIYYIEGELLRYVPEENDWVAVVKDAPFGVEDTFFSGSRGMTEMIVPNGSWIRIDSNTQIQFIDLESDLSEIDVASGVARIYNKSTDTVIKATSPFGYVLADPGTVFDLYVGENSVEVVAIEGTVSFVRSEGNARYDVSAGSPSILADQNKVATGEGNVDGAWDRWNNNRDSVWAARLKAKGSSAEYLPPGLRYDAHCLDEHGRWELVAYKGGNYWFWRPTGVYVGWSPFSMGVWAEWCGDQTWIPAEPFGYVTHHYGNWVFIGNFWYWAPPVVSVRVGFPLLDIGFYWYPGRVSWIHRGVYVGWVPLAPHETYYSHHNWGGPHHRVIKENVIHAVVRIESLSNSKRAVIVRQDKFHGVESYRYVRVANVHPTIINKYNIAPIVNNTVINNYETSSQRYKYANATAQERPSSTVLKRVKQNEEIINRDRKEDAESIRQQVKSVKEGNISRDARVEVPRITDRRAMSRDVNPPESEKDIQQTEINTGAGIATEKRTAETIKTKEQQTGQSVGQSERVGTTSQTKQEKADNQTERIVPSARNKQDRTVTQPERVDTSSQTKQEKTNNQTERVVPSARSQQNRTVTQTEREDTSEQTQQDKDAVQTERTVPSARNKQDRTVTQSDGAVNTRSTQQERTDIQAGRAASAAQNQQNRAAVQPDSSTQSASTESGRDRLNKIVSSESSTEESKAQDNTSQRRSRLNSEQQESGEEERTGR